MDQAEDFDNLALVLHQCLVNLDRLIADGGDSPFSTIAAAAKQNILRLMTRLNMRRSRGEYFSDDEVKLIDFLVQHSAANLSSQTNENSDQANPDGSASFDTPVKGLLGPRDWTMPITEERDEAVRISKLDKAARELAEQAAAGSIELAVEARRERDCAVQAQAELAKRLAEIERMLVETQMSQSPPPANDGAFKGESPTDAPHDEQSSKDSSTPPEEEPPSERAPTGRRARASVKRPRQ